MPTIVVLNGKNVGQWFTIGEMPLVFGRDEQLLAELSDPCVSQRHMQAAIDPADGSAYVEDLKSRNGIVVNSQPSRGRKVLNDGDTVQLGFTLLVYTEHDFASPRAARTFVKKTAKHFKAMISDLDAAEEKRLEKLLKGTQGFHPVNPQ